MEVIKSGGDETDTFRDQIKTGKLNVSDLYPNDQKEDFVRGEIKIGKIKTKVSLCCKTQPEVTGVHWRQECVNFCQ